MEYQMDIEYPMQTLYIAKSFYDHGKLNLLLSALKGGLGHLFPWMTLSGVFFK